MMDSCHVYPSAHMPRAPLFTAALAGKYESVWGLSVVYKLVKCGYIQLVMFSRQIISNVFGDLFFL